MYIRTAALLIISALPVQVRAQDDVAARIRRVEQGLLTTGVIKGGAVTHVVLAGPGAPLRMQRQRP